MPSGMSTHPLSSTINWDTQVSLKLLVESMPIAVVIVDAHGKIVYINAKLQDMFGYQPHEALGRSIEILMPERFRRAHVEHRHSYMVHPHVRSMGSGMDLAGRRKDGSEFPLEAGLSSLQLGNEPLVVVTVTDISKRKQVEEMLAQQVEERTREVQRRHEIAEGVRGILRMLISNRSLSESLNFIAAEGVRLLGVDACIIYSRDERLGTLTRQAVHGAMSVELEEHFLHHLPQNRSFYNEPMVIAPQLEPTPAFAYTAMVATSAAPDVSWAYVTVPVRDTQVYGLIVFAIARPYRLANSDIDLALRIADLTVLAFANAHLRAQIEHSAVAAERSRIARDLHDAVTQTLFSASIIAGVLPTIWERNQDEGRRRLAELRELTRGALAEMRTLLLELRPAKLVEVDLADLLKQLAEAISGRARVPVEVHVEGNADVPADVKLALYRVAQEALNNIAKHAQATSAQINLVRSPEEISLTVSDDGVGFQFERIAPQHLGLGIMRERADAIGASLSVRSALNEGTTVEVCWVNNEEMDETPFTG
jgi:PAS domain S-box-containing protein